MHRNFHSDRIDYSNSNNTTIVANNFKNKDVNDPNDKLLKEGKFNFTKYSVFGGIIIFVVITLVVIFRVSASNNLRGFGGLEASFLNFPSLNEHELIHEDIEDVSIEEFEHNLESLLLEGLPPKPKKSKKRGKNFSINLSLD